VSLHKRAPSKGQGVLVVGCLRAYHEWALYSKERALAEVYVWAERCVGLDGDGAEVAQAFRLGKDGNARKAAAKLYSDALTALSDWVRVWNRKNPVAVFGLV
jgi:hypothetical protein